MMNTIISWILKNIPRTTQQKFAPFILRIIGFFLRGKKYTCPIIGKSYRKFFPYGRGEYMRDSVLCPESLSLERHRLIWLYLKQETPFFNTRLQVLHFAPEHCFIKYFERQHGPQYISADLSSPLAKMLCNIEDIPFQENTFDCIICNHVLEHVDNDVKALQELYRVLKKGGWGILQVPFFSPIPKKTQYDPKVTNSSEREKLYGQADHVRKYGLDYKDILSSVGFEVEVIDFVKTFPEDMQTKYALDKTEKIHIVRKI